ncbi:HAMP domain-containing sensor histidine kinase [Hyphomicrobium sp. 99]|uniref:ATP-binding protein n=1 Tax=Hyphomicrobium sp. 99 TaxID=1163419 RepID=UPI0009E3A4D9|nr:HAMP domain-containing sensor histidine kinase [Hyphomicrobium sp. 99]
MSSLKGRLIFAATIWIAAGMVLAGFVLSEVFKQHATKQLYEEVYEHLDELLRLTDFKTGNSPHLPQHLSDPRYALSLSGYYWEIQEGDRVLAASRSLDGKILPTPPNTSTDTAIRTYEIVGPTGTVLAAERAVSISPNNSLIRFIVGTDHRHLAKMNSSFDNTLMWSLIAFGLSLILGATLLILYALKPFGELRISLGNVRAGTEKNLHGNFPSEVLPLVEELNAVLKSTSELIQRARTQAGNLAHGLKTPLAILTDEAHRIERKGLPQSAATILSQCRRMQTQIDYQTTRARAVAMRSMPGTVANVRRASEDVARALRRLHEGSGVTICVDVPEITSVACDPQDLNEMLANIVDNACKYAKAAVRIEAAGRTSDKLVHIRIDDDGRGLPPEAFEVVFGVGEQWDSRADGSGLGLAIVRDLAQLYGGNVGLQKSPLGGLSVILSLPVALNGVNNAAPTLREGQSCSRDRRNEPQMHSPAETSGGPDPLSFTGEVHRSSEALRRLWRKTRRIALASVR